jgi:hypothetical protein
VSISIDKLKDIEKWIDDKSKDLGGVQVFAIMTGIPSLLRFEYYRDSKIYPIDPNGKS